MLLGLIWSVAWIGHCPHLVVSIFGTRFLVLLCLITTSDHSPLLVTMLPSVVSGPKPSRLHSMWLLHDSFMDTVSHSLEASMVRDPMTCVMYKLKLLHSCLRNWKASVFRNVYPQIYELENRLLDAQQCIYNEGFSKDLFHDKVEAHRTLKGLLSRQKALL